MCLFYYYGKESIINDFNENIDNYKTIRFHNNKIIEENFFLIDSNNLNKIDSHMYGYTVSKEGILTDNFYKKIGYYKQPEPQGVYIMIRKHGNEIRIDQDFNGCFGLYIYENKDTKYFALSNSFLLLEEYLIGKQNISLNRDFINNFIVTNSSSPSIFETMIKEIIKISPNSFILINIEKKSFKIFYINYNENTIPYDSNEGLKIIDEWIDKWGYILRSLKNKTDNFYTSLSGDYNTRITLSILLNSGIDITKILIKSSREDKNNNEEDLKIANNISETFGIKLNNLQLDEDETKWSLNNSIFCILYSKLGFTKNYYQNNGFYNKPRFYFNGIGGEIIRGFPHYNIKTCIEKLCSLDSLNINNDKDFYSSSLRLCNRSINMLKRKKPFIDDYELSTLFYYNGIIRNNFCKIGIEKFLSNIYSLQPLLDPDIKKIKFDLNKTYPHDLLAYLFIRFSSVLIHFPFQGNRTIDDESIKRAEKLNKNLPIYKIKSDLNINFFIDYDRKTPVPHSNDNIEYKNNFKNIFKSSKFSEFFYKVNKKIIHRGKKNSLEKTIKADLRQKYIFLETAIAIELENLKKMKQIFLNKSFEFGKNILNYLFN